MQVKEFTEQFDSLVFPIHGVRLPTFFVEKKYKDMYGVDESVDNEEFLRALCVKGFNGLKLKKDSKEYNEYAARVKYELGIFSELGFVDYILLVWDVINFCKENNIPTGLGRGSAAGSLVLYLIGVTKIDSIKHGLYFERFVSKTRAKKQVIDGITYLDGSLMCDVDLDICYYNRHKVLEYLDKKYAGKTSKILTLNTLSAKLVMKEVGKIAGLKSEDEMTLVTGMIPKNHGIVEDLDKAYETSAEFRQWCDANPKVYKIAQTLKDLNKNKGVHPSGVMISYDTLEDSCPTELTSDKEIVSSYDMNWVSLFTIKLDALGLRGVSVVDDVCKSLGINVSDIDINDTSIYKALQDLKYPHGLFQIEADLAYRTTQKVAPRNFKQLSAILALARPGAMQFIDQFAEFTNDGKYEVIHPFFDDILKETGGVCIYQEQMMKMANKIGFTLDEAEILRRIVGKKKKEEVAAWQSKIEAKVKENKLDPKISEVLWKILEDSASYSFNKSHSVAYAALTAVTVYLKFNHPTQFYLSLLKMTKHEPDSIGEISKIHKEMQYFGIKLLPPCLKVSEMDFTIEGNDIRFGLSSIKGISDKTIEKLNKFKRSYANKFEMFESAQQAGLSIGIVAALIQAGTMESFGKHRALLVYEAQLWNVLKPKEKEYALKCGDKFVYALADIVRALSSTIKDEKSKPIIKESRLATIKKHSVKYKLIYNQNMECESFANWWYERKLLGYVTHTRLIDIFKAQKPNLQPISEVNTSLDGEKVCFIGVLDENPTPSVSKQKVKYAKFTISDESGISKVLLFSLSEKGILKGHTDKLEACKELNGGRLPRAEDVVIVEGKRTGEDAIFADTISAQQNKIYTKLSDFKDDEVAEAKA